MPVSLSALQTRALVLDVEGTTTPIAFVYEVLFPFARTHASVYLQREAQSTTCRRAIEQLREERAVDASWDDLSPREAASHGDQYVGPAAILPYFHWLMDRDRKSPGLKALQGLIWQDGFRSGELRGEVYEDVPRSFERWRRSKRDIYIYSSGSILAQQLLFGSARARDLTTHLTGHFDTTLGPKTESESYRQIAQRIGVAPHEVLFVSDATTELDAARAVGLHTVFCRRDASGAADAGSHPVIGSFDEILD